MEKGNYRGRRNGDKNNSKEDTVFGTLGFGMSWHNNQQIYLNLSKPCTITDPKGGLFFGELGNASMLRCFHKDKFVLKLVPEYALLKKEGDFIRVYDHYGQATEQEIESMVLKGWKRKNEYMAI